MDEKTIYNSKDDCLDEIREFSNSKKQEIIKSAKENKAIIISFMDLASFSPTLAEGLISNPKEMIEMLELSLVETGLMSNPKILIKDLPSSEKIPISKLRTKHMDCLIEVEGKILRKDNTIRHKIQNAKFQCANCGSIISILQGEEFSTPKRCSCGNKGNFKLLSKDYEDFLTITIQDENKGTIDINFDSKFLDEFGKILKEGNVLSVIGILDSKNINNSTEVIFELIPLGLSLVKETTKKGTDIEDYIDALKSKGNQGAYLFEEFVGDLFTKKGYKTKVTKKTGDFGIDIIAEKENEKIAIQCKLTDQNMKIPNTLIQKALGSLVSPYNANKLIFVTTSDEYTQNAIDQIKTSKVPVELWNRKRLIAEVEAYMEDLEEGWEKLCTIKESKKEIEFTPQVDIDRISTGVSSSQKSKIIIVREAIARLETKLGRIIPIEAVYKEFENKLDRQEIDDIILKLCFAGDLFKPKRDFIQRM